MKKSLRKILIIFFLSIIGTTGAFAQSNPPPPPGDHGTGSDQTTGEGAPIGGGVAMLLTMGAAYGGKKYYDYRKKLKNEMED